MSAILRKMWNARYQNVELPFGNHPRNMMLVTNKLNILDIVHCPISRCIRNNWICFHLQVGRISGKFTQTCQKGVRYKVVPVCYMVVVEVQNLGARWRSVVIALQSHFSPERTLGIHLIGGWVGPKTGLDVLEKRNILSLEQTVNTISRLCILQSKLALNWLRLADIAEFLSVFHTGIIYFSPTKCAVRLWVSPSLLFKGERGALSPGLKQPGSEADHFHLVPRLRFQQYFTSPTRLPGVYRDSFTLPFYFDFNKLFHLHLVT